MDENTQEEKKPVKYGNVRDAARIYLLPNFFTAGNMCCGFFSLCKCIEANHTPNIAAANELYMMAVYLIFGACIFDLFDGRMARMFKKESMFGAEFDSIADTVSFGVAPAFLVYFLIFDPARSNSFDWVNSFIASTGAIIGFVYLLCAGIRLAKFNVLTNPLIPGNEKKSPASDFMGIPSPVAAAITASFVLLLTHLNSDENAVEATSTLKTWLPIILLPTMLLVSILMVTNIPYPTFKHIDWNSKAKAQAFIFIILFIIVAAKFHIFAIPAALLIYVFYGLIRALKMKIKKAKAGNVPVNDVEETF
ncbi:MAG: phosphatidylcholine/phosphatidylserine synthase [Opitutales bacterium]|nr:phosphatidylcholine/phosphatidylserine synthase [Opitutales bacterium]